MTRKAYPLRLNFRVHEAIAEWADDELRSVNAQIEYLLRQALPDSKRMKSSS
ncbi:MAG: Arc family DNA binding domain-containing protein [Actinomycetota bacterium]|nr:Arc family DNA binding domain-containing protein [Actinomycetota bacterium]